MFFKLDDWRILNLNNVAYIEGKVVSGGDAVSITIVTTAIFSNNDNALDRFNEKFVIETSVDRWAELLNIIQNDKKFFVL